jgi:hypothetical protein
MKVSSSIFLTTFFLMGCVSPAEQAYYDTAKSISKDQTMAQTACWAAVSEIAKNGDESVKANAMRLGYYTCKVETIKLETPKRLGL